MDDATLGKPGNLAVPLQGQQLEDGRALANYDDQEDLDNQQESILDFMLGLQGGAKMAKMSTAKKTSSPMAKKPMNAYMTKLQEARKSNAKSFEYNGKTYVQTKAPKSGMIIYK